MKDGKLFWRQALRIRETVFIIRVIGRLVQLVRILGRHPRGRRFEFCTAHQNISKSEKGTYGYDTANYNAVVGESLGARWCSFAQHSEENAASPRFFSSIIS